MKQSVDYDLIMDDGYDKTMDAKDEAYYKKEKDANIQELPNGSPDNLQPDSLP